MIHTEQHARAAGFTVAIVADSSMHTLELLIKPGTDLDSTFPAFDRGACEMLQVHGWNFMIEAE